MKTIRALMLVVLALAGIVELSGCASKDEPSMTWTQRWKRMREQQDADAAATVQTDSRPIPGGENPALDIPTIDH